MKSSNSLKIGTADIGISFIMVVTAKLLQTHIYVDDIILLSIIEVVVDEQVKS